MLIITLIIIPIKDGEIMFDYKERKTMTLGSLRTRIIRNKKKYKRVKS